MSGFNTIKKSRKRSHEIEEKLNVLNRELEKTKDIQEQPAMNTSGLYTPVQQSLPQDPVQVPNPDPDPEGTPVKKAHEAPEASVVLHACSTAKGSEHRDPEELSDPERRSFRSERKPPPDSRIAQW